MINVYLGGNALYTFYRDYAQAKYGDKFKLIDPIKENGAVVDEVKGKVTINCSVEELVNKDKEWVANADIFIALIDESTFGTTMEVLHAYNNQVPVYVILGTESHKFENDFWLSYHTTRFFLSDDSYKDGVDKCFDYILKTLQPN